MDNLDDRLDLLLIETEILEKLFIGEKYLVVTDKHGSDIIITLNGTHDKLYYKWDIDRCERRARQLIESVVLLENYSDEIYNQG